MSARVIAVDILVEIFKHKQTLPQAMAVDKIAASLLIMEAKDKAFCYNMVMLVLRHYDKLMGLVVFLADKKVRFKKYDRVILTLLLGLVQILFLNTPIYAVQSESKKMLKRASELAHRKFVHAIFQQCEEKRSEFGKHRKISVWQELWQKQYGEAVAESLWQAIYEVPPLDLQFKSVEMREAFEAQFSGEVIDSHADKLRIRSDGAVADLPFYTEGQWWIQDRAAGLAAEILAVTAGERVLDLCAAPGGKTAQLANSGAKVTALDKSAEKIEILQENLKRLSFDVEIIHADVLEYEDSAGFSAILLDAPCSASGTLRHNAELPVIKSPEIIETLAESQFALLNHAYTKLLQAGGRLIYSVCSLQAEEGEAVLTRFHKAFPEAEIVPLTEKQASPLPCHIAEGKYLRTLPSDMQDKGRLDGFFLAFIRKVQ